MNANQDQLSHFMVELTTSVRREIRRGPASHFSKNRHRHLDRLCLNMAEVVNTRTPGVVEDKLLKILGRDIMPSTLVGDQFEARLMRRSSR